MILQVHPIISLSLNGSSHRAVLPILLFHHSVVSLSPPLSFNPLVVYTEPITGLSFLNYLACLSLDTLSLSFSLQLSSSYSLHPPSSAVGDFFGYSCVPGVKDLQHDPKGNNPKNLCEACIGDENDRHICVNNPRERHYGEAGALR